MLCPRASHLTVRSWHADSRLTVYFALTFTLAWAAWAAAAFLTSRMNVSSARALFFIPGTFAPAIVALWMTSRYDATRSQRDLLSRLFHWRVPGRWYVFAAGYIVVAKLIAAVLFRLGDGEWPTFGAVPLYVMLVATVFSTPVQAGEEIGWRGYALPRLGQAIGFQSASVLLGVIWALWHLPLFLIANTDSTGQPFAVFLLAVLPISVAMTWLYLKTGGSLLPVMLMHAAINNFKEIATSAAPNAPGVLSLNASAMTWFTIVVLWVAAAYFLVRMPGRFAYR